MTGMTTPRRKNTKDRVTVEALQYYVPIFHKGDEAAEKLLEADKYSAEELNSLRTVAKLKELTVEKIASLAGPLITREINKLIKNSHLNGREDLFDILYYAGINGMIKGMRHFDVEKLNKSSTNYLFQWIVTYAKKELNILEAPFGIAPSRFQRYKKISAVRKKLSEQLDRYATNEEVLEFFLSGKADLKTMNGKVEKDDKPYAVNQSMTLDIIEEQENFEQNLNYVNLLDPLEDYSAEIKLSEKELPIFEETLLGAFVLSYNFTDEAIAVIASDLNLNYIPDNLGQTIDNMDASDYRSLSSRWKDLMRDVNGPFYSFLQEYTKSHSNTVENFDIFDTMKNIEEYDKNIKPSRYNVLFKEKRIEKI